MVYFGSILNIDLPCKDKDLAKQTFDVENPLEEPSDEKNISALGVNQNPSE